MQELLILIKGSATQTIIYSLFESMTHCSTHTDHYHHHEMCIHIVFFRQKQLDQSESRASAQRGKLSAVSESQQQVEVERQLLQQEKAQLSDALARVGNVYLCSFSRFDILLFDSYDPHFPSRLRAVTQSSPC